MKKIILILALGFIVVTACMIYLVRSGVSLRAAPIIRPSIMNADLKNVAHGTVVRLYPDFQTAEMVLWGILPESTEFKTIREETQKEFEKVFSGQQVHWIQDLNSATTEDLKNCQKPCWILLPQEQANELAPHDAIETKIKPLGRNYFSLTLLTFTRNPQVSDTCVQQKRLSLECLKPLAVSESERKMKEPNARYFFMRKYNERDFFLFLQEPLPQSP